MPALHDVRAVAPGEGGEILLRGPEGGDGAFVREAVAADEPAVEQQFALDVALGPRQASSSQFAALTQVFRIIWPVAIVWP